MILGTMAAFLFQRYQMRGGKVLQLLILLPYILPGIILGVSLSLFYKFLGVQASLISVAVGHITFITPVVMFLVMDRLKRFDRNLELASMDLGATSIETFLKITLPNIKGALISGALLGFTISFDEIIVTFFLIGNQSTLPLKIWSMIKHGYSPQINAIYTLIVILSLSIIVLSGKKLFSKEG
nr:ABC transporter permease subunit [Lederbergia citrea]